jgi:hypothetical protein
VAAWPAETAVLKPLEMQQKGAPMHNWLSAHVMSSVLKGGGKLAKLVCFPAAHSAWKGVCPPIQVVILGSGAADYERRVAKAQAMYPYNVRGVLKFDVPLSHRRVFNAGWRVGRVGSKQGMPVRFQEAGSTGMCRWLEGLPFVLSVATLLYCLECSVPEASHDLHDPAPRSAAVGSIHAGLLRAATCCSCRHALSPVGSTRSVGALQPM